MPTYEYRCPKGHEFERFQRMSEPPLATCPECGAEAERLLSAGAGLIFKGSGFYITDYRSEGYKKAAEAEKGNGAGTKAETSDSKGDATKGDASKGESSKGESSSKGGPSTGKSSGSAKRGGATAADD